MVKLYFLPTFEVAKLELFFDLSFEKVRHDSGQEEVWTLHFTTGHLWRTTFGHPLMESIIMQVKIVQKLNQKHPFILYGT